MAHDCLHDSHSRMGRIEVMPGHRRCLLWSSMRIGSPPQRTGDTSLIVTGGPTGVCVESTVRDARCRDEACVVLQDGTGEPIGPRQTPGGRLTSGAPVAERASWGSRGCPGPGPTRQPG